MDIIIGAREFTVQAVDGMGNACKLKFTVEGPMKIQDYEKKLVGGKIIDVEFIYE